MYLPIYLPTHPSINPHTYLPTKPHAYHLPTYLFTYPSIQLPTTYPPPAHPFTYNPLPTYLPIYPPTQPPIHLPITYPPMHPPIHLLTYPPHPSTLSTYLLTYLPNFYFLFPITYLRPTYHPTTYYLPHSLVVI